MSATFASHGANVPASLEFDQSAAQPAGMWWSHPDASALQYHAPWSLPSLPQRDAGLAHMAAPWRAGASGSAAPSTNDQALHSTGHDAAEQAHLMASTAPWSNAEQAQSLARCEGPGEMACSTTPVSLPFQGEPSAASLGQTAPLGLMPAPELTPSALQLYAAALMAPFHDDKQLPYGALALSPFGVASVHAHPPLWASSAEEPFASATRLLSACPDAPLRSEAASPPPDDGVRVRCEAPQPMAMAAASGSALPLFNAAATSPPLARAKAKAPAAPPRDRLERFGALPAACALPSDAGERSPPECATASTLPCDKDMLPCSEAISDGTQSSGDEATAPPSCQSVPPRGGAVLPATLSSEVPSGAVSLTMSSQRVPAHNSGAPPPPPSSSEGAPARSGGAPPPPPSVEGAPAHNGGAPPPPPSVEGAPARSGAAPPPPPSVKGAPPRSGAAPPPSLSSSKGALPRGGGAPPPPPHSRDGTSRTGQPRFPGTPHMGTHRPNVPQCSKRGGAPPPPPVVQPALTSGAPAPKRPRCGM